ncbi:MAG TPA: hypothetical protein VFM46_14570, partial [Pseudomonadales bacterium]|nr:hypothetical protein [Pseudomonadales bacterium]
MLKRILIAVIVVWAVALGISVFWPAYDWDGHIISPDGRFDAVILRGDKAAFDDFSYRIYVFPRHSAPNIKLKGEHVLFLPPWRGKKYLIYAGYNYPM